MVSDDLNLEMMGNGFRQVSKDPSLSRMEQYILRLLELLEKNLSGNITKSAESGEMSAISKLIKSEMRKSKRNPNIGMNLKGSDFMKRS